MSGRKVFLIGPGFIGREILDRLLAEGYDVTVLSHRETLSDELEEIGAKTRSGGLDDSEVIADQAYLSDIVIHCATADHPSSVAAILAGVEKRAGEGDSTIYIHNSGAGVLDDSSGGEFKSDKIYEDDKPEDIDALSDAAPHRSVDLSIIRTRELLGNKAKLVIMFPPAIYGFNPKYGRMSIQMPTLTRFALQHGYAGYIGQGKAVWSSIHVFDLAEAYIVLLHWLEKSSADEVLTNPYFSCENGTEFSWKEAAAEIGKILHAIGRLQTPEPKSIAEEEYVDLFGKDTASVLGSNSRNRANRLRGIGWSPRHKSLYQSLAEDEVPVILSEADKKSASSK